MDMYANNRTGIRCPCTRCKGVILDPFDRGSLKAHLLMNGFMDGYTRWISEDDDEDVHMAGNNDMGLDEEMTDRPEDDGTGHGGGEESGHGGGEDSGHGEEESGHGGEEATDTLQSSTLLSSVVQDPHVRDLLHKSTTSDRAASREEAKLAQLEVDSKTPLYDGCDPEVTRLSFTLELLNTKAKNKWTDARLDEHLKHIHNKVLPVGNLCPTSVEEAKKIVCPLDIPHIRYHACINDCILYQE
jgi:hypothetical protein